MKDPIFQLADLVRETGYAIYSYHGPGHLEKVYENAMAHRLTRLGLEVERQRRFLVLDHDGTIIGEYLADLIVNRSLILEIKAANALTDHHLAQLLGYLRSSRIPHGLLMNFGGPRFEIRKLVMSPPSAMPA